MDTGVLLKNHTRYDGTKQHYRVLAKQSKTSYSFIFCTYVFPMAYMQEINSYFINQPTHQILFFVSLSVQCEHLNIYMLNI